MTMKLQWDPNQNFQLDAIAAIADLFEGQPQDAPEYSVVDLGEEGSLLSGHDQTELGVGNRLLLDEEELRKNLRAIQERNDIAVLDESVEPEGWRLFDQPANAERLCPHFSVEMETGTGKTYVYLRTIFELSQRYGFQKFIIVVPSVAIREGVLHNIEVTSEHLRALYNNLPFEHFVYDARRINRLRQFATSTTLQILVMNIDVFRKNFTGTEDEQKSNVIYKESDKLSGRQPIEFVQAARPVVIIDEPQSVDATDKAQEAIKALNPLCTLRYSATHRNLYNRVYRLDPIRAFELRLVKQIVVATATAERDANDALVRVEGVDYKKGIKARLRIHVQGPQGPTEKTVTVKQGADLFSLSNERAAYASGYEVAEINAEPGNEYVRFSNGNVVRAGEEIGGLQEDVWRAQIHHTVRKHLDKELLTQERGIKVLTLFFIDRVANYRIYDETGTPSKGKFALAFEESMAELTKEPQYQALTWLQRPVEELHNGYFSQDKKGVYKDTKGTTAADDETYNLIMRGREQLLSLEEPLRFIFSHSALREGWDNPNVFQICTLNETKSVVKKRQEIGRGLRIPVNQEGKRVFDESVNRLYVMANESYEDFARALQTEYEEDCGVTFGVVPLSALARITRVVDDLEQPIGKENAETIRGALIEQGMLDESGKIQPAFDPKTPGFDLELPKEFSELTFAVVDVVSSYQIQRHIRKEKDERVNKLRKEVQLSPEFEALWSRIKPRTTYRVEFDTDVLVDRAIQAINKMPKILPPTISIEAGILSVDKAGVSGKTITASSEQVDLTRRALPDLLAYLQNETDLTRSSLVRILKGCERLGDVFINPQRFLDEVARTIKAELHTLLVDGIKYEKLSSDVPDSEWEMLRFENEELINYFSALSVEKSVYEYVVYESDVERRFAEDLDAREDIKLFVKLPSWFKIQTPLGSYNPDWAILKDDGQALYLVRETKGTKDILKLRTEESDKIRCGIRHFETLDVPFEVVVSASEV